MPALVSCVCRICLLGFMLAGGLHAHAGDRPQAQSPGPDVGSPRVCTAELTIFLMTKGRSGALDVRPEEIRLLEDGREQPITSFTPDPNAPLLIIILVDVSRSMRDDLQRKKEMERVSQFLHSLWREQVTGLVVAFNDRLYVPSSIASDLAEMDRELEKVRDFEPRESTAIYDAIFTVCASERFARPGAKILLVLSNFEDNSSIHTFEQTIKVAGQSGTAVFSLFLAGKLGTGSRRARRVAQSLSETTGGLFLPAKRYSEVPRLLELSANAVRGLYRASYVPHPRKKEDKPHRLVWKPLREDLTVPAPGALYARVP